MKKIFLIFLLINSIACSANNEIKEFFTLLDEYIKVNKNNNSQENVQKLYYVLQTKLNGIKNSPSIKHMSETLHKIIDKFSVELTKPTLQRMIIAGLVKEQELTSEGYISFVHGRRRYYNFLTQLYLFLNSIVTNQKINIDFIPTHIKQPVSDITNEKTKRKTLIEKGNENYDIETNRNLLFLNRFMFSNTIIQTGANSFEYMLGNMNCLNINITIKKVFTMFGLENFYPKYNDQLNILHEKYNNITRIRSKKS